MTTAADIVELAAEAIRRRLFVRARDLCDIGLNQGLPEDSKGALRALREEADRARTGGKRGEESAEYAAGIEAFHRSDFATAARWLRSAVGVTPDSAEAHAHLGMSLIALGELPEGWREYEWRCHLAWSGARRLVAPAWSGQPLPGGTLLLWEEQGSGDAVQFIRFAIPAAQASGARVVFHGHPRLVRLFSSCPGVAEAIARDQPFPRADAHASLMSLPAMLGTCVADVAAMGPYLSAEPALVPLWAVRLGGGRRPRIGLVWQGNPAFGSDYRRSFPFAAYLPLLRAFRGRASFVSLQKGVGEEQLAAAAHEPVAAIPSFGPLVDNGPDGFVETAAIMANLDLLITSDTSAAHLAGALGLPAWIVLGDAADWRWGLAPASSPFYPRVRLFRRCPAEGDSWMGVMERIAGALAERLDADGGGA